MLREMCKGNKRRYTVWTKEDEEMRVQRAGSVYVISLSMMLERRREGRWAASSALTSVRASRPCSDHFRLIPISNIVSRFALDAQGQIQCFRNPNHRFIQLPSHFESFA